MFELLRQKLNEKISLRDEEFTFCKNLFVSRRLSKRHFLLQEGNVCKYTAFVEKGLLRCYTLDDKGAEHILQFAMEGWWMADIYSFLTNEPSVYNIEAMEDTELLLITKASQDLLLEKFPKVEHYFHILTQNNLIATQKRLMGSLTETAEEKYLKFIKIYPDCLQRVPLHMIASFLGITRETLSRVRKEMSTGRYSGCTDCFYQVPSMQVSIFIGCVKTLAVFLVSHPTYDLYQYNLLSYLNKTSMCCD